MASFPAVISLTLTNTCNLRCRMCGQWGTSGYLNRREKPVPLPAARWIELVEEAARHGVKVVGIRGGEPFLFPGIIQILKAIKERGVFGYIDTNGTLLERFASEILESGIDAINLSVDGPEEIHDRVRGVPGAF
jgi:MoaA/NifB/PqqE/SkfB family radical SAM enzyme